MSITRSGSTSSGRAWPACSRRRLLQGLGSLALGAVWPASRAAPDAAGPPRLLLASEAPAHIDPAGWLVSEKLDGVRALWTGRELRLRGGGTVAAPAWFTAGLPPMPLDGELWAGRGRFDEASGTVRRVRPVDAAWQHIRYMAFELPDGAGPFHERVSRLEALAAEAAVAAAFRFGKPVWQVVDQRQVPDRTALQRWLDEVVAAGGEGLMLHRADAPYVTGRSELLLKLKPVHDAEAVVVGHLPGQGRHAGRLGALKVRMANGVSFEIGTGFSDAERDRPPAIGSTITFTHRGFTPAGVPRFASFLRVRSDA